MIYDAETVQQAMARAGRLAQSDLAAALTGFERLGLSRQERLAAIASAVAACQRKRHPADEGAGFIHALRAPHVAPLLARLSERLDHLVEIGLGYLSLSRETATCPVENRNESRWCAICRRA